MEELIKREVKDNGLCILTFDRPNSGANIFDPDTLAALDDQLEAIEKDSSVKGLVITSAKSKIFIAGADLNVFKRVDITEREIGELIQKGHDVFTRLEKLRVTTVAAINGACLGGGFELALACDYRIASRSSAAKIGLPEVQLGILPAWGGSTRLPRLVGLVKAMGAIMTGKTFASAKAFKMGLVDGLAHPENLLDAAEKKALSSGKFVESSHWDNLPVLGDLACWKARSDTLKKTFGNYPAPLAALDVMQNAVTGTKAESFIRERKAFVKLVKSDTARNLVNIFFLQERAKKIEAKGLSDDEKKAIPRSWGQVLVVGAGVMGGGIAQWVSSRGMRVIMKDINREQLANGMAVASKIFNDGKKKRVFTAAAAQAGMDRIVPVSEDIPLERVDLVIEAVVERMDIKKMVFTQLEGQVGAHTLLATNTSALSIDEISSELKRPERLVGIHFFNPVHRMKLVEVIYGKQSSPASVAAAVAFVKKIGKLPVIVKDSPGFLVNRILMPYLAEAVKLFDEGYGIKDLDKKMLKFGMPMGPLRLIDEVGLDVSRHVADDLSNRLEKGFELSGTLNKMMGRGWLGKKSGCGFYHYPKGGSGNKGENEDVKAMRIGNRGSDANDGGLAVDRMVLLMINEAARCLEEGVVEQPHDVDFGMIMGTGWAPFRGGPLRYADSIGLKRVVEKLHRLSHEVCPAFEPCELLLRKSQDGSSFYNDSQNTKSKTAKMEKMS